MNADTLSLSRLLQRVVRFPCCNQPKDRCCRERTNDRGTRQDWISKQYPNEGCESRPIKVPTAEYEAYERTCQARVIKNAGTPSTNATRYATTVTAIGNPGNGLCSNGAVTSVTTTVAANGAICEAQGNAWDTTHGNLTSRFSGRTMCIGCWHFIPHGLLQPVVRRQATKEARPSHPNRRALHPRCSACLACELSSALEAQFERRARELNIAAPKFICSHELSQISARLNRQNPLDLRKAPV